MPESPVQAMGNKWSGEVCAQDVPYNAVLLHHPNAHIVQDADQNTSVDGQISEDGVDDEPDAPDALNGPHANHVKTRWLPNVHSCPRMTSMFTLMSRRQLRNRQNRYHFQSVLF